MSEWTWRDHVLTRPLDTRWPEPERLEYLRSLGVDIRVSETPGGAVLMVFHVPESQAGELAAWLDQQLWGNDVPRVTEQGREVATIHNRMVPPVTALWLGIIAFAGLWLWAGFAQPWDWMIVDPRWWQTDTMEARWGALVGTVLSGEAWRLIAPVWLHFSLEHALFNMLALYIFGIPLERTLGSLRLGTAILVTGVISNVIQLLAGQVTFGGFSGVNYGLMGMAWVLKKQNVSAHLDAIPTAIIYCSLVFAFIGLLGVTDLFGLSMANAAHFSGLAAGCALGAWFGLKKGGQSPQKL